MDIGGGGGIQLGNGANPLEQWFFETPVCTRYWATAIVATSVLVQCKVLSPFHLFFSVRSVFNKHQVSCSLGYALSQD
jgi:Derlin-2/3